MHFHRPHALGILDHPFAACFREMDTASRPASDAPNRAIEDALGRYLDVQETQDEWLMVSYPRELQPTPGYPANGSPNTSFASSRMPGTNMSDSTPPARNTRAALAIQPGDQSPVLDLRPECTLVQRYAALKTLQHKRLLAHAQTDHLRNKLAACCAFLNEDIQELSDVRQDPTTKLYFDKLSSRFEEDRSRYDCQLNMLRAAETELIETDHQFVHSEWQLFDQLEVLMNRSSPPSASGNVGSSGEIRRSKLPMGPISAP